MTGIQTPEDQAADLDNVERDANHWWSWKLLFPTMNMVYSILHTLRWKNFTLFLTSFQSKEHQLSWPRLSQAVVVFIEVIKSEWLKMWLLNICSVKNNIFKGISRNFRTSRFQTFFGEHAPRRASMLTFTGPDTYFPSLFRLQSKIVDHGRLSLRISS